LLKSVVDPALPAPLRATAALLLRNHLTFNERARIANAARVTVSARLRTVLELVAGGTATETAILSEIDALSPRERPWQTLWRAIVTELARELPRARAICESAMRATQSLIATAVARGQSESSALAGLLRKHGL
jgi:hypothetical protein